MLDKSINSGPYCFRMDIISSSISTGITGVARTNEFKCLVRL